MAQAFRTVWLEPEEQQDNITPQLQPRRQPRQAVVVRQSPLVAVSMVVMVAIAVGLLIAYVNSYVRIAHFDFQRQALSAQLRQLQDESAQLKLDVAHLENTPRVVEVAKAQNLDFPTPDRVHYINATNDIPRTSVAQATPTGKDSWFASAGRDVMAKLDTVFQRLSRGPGSPAYAQE
ncbi:MAG TPA: hypothetical protein VHV83_01455 [Armatimonadota bacterium]|nr:hypothetical protein [Armatimonadota bacterium]